MPSSSAAWGGRAPVPHPPKCSEEDVIEQPLCAQDLLHNQIHCPTSLCPSIQASLIPFIPFLSSASIEDNERAPPLPSPLPFAAIGLRPCHFPLRLRCHRIVVAAFSASFTTSTTILVFAVILNPVLECSIAAELLLSLLEPSSEPPLPSPGVETLVGRNVRPRGRKNLRYHPPCF